MALEQIETLYIYVTQRGRDRDIIMSDCVLLTGNNHEIKSNDNDDDPAVVNEW